MVALAYLVQFTVIGLIALAMMLFGFSWVGAFAGLVVYLLSTWMVSSLVQKKCPFCDSSISTKAIKCPKCQSDLPAD